MEAPVDKYRLMTARTEVLRNAREESRKVLAYQKLTEVIIFMSPGWCVVIAFTDHERYFICSSLFEMTAMFKRRFGKSNNTNLSWPERLR